MQVLNFQGDYMKAGVGYLVAAMALTPLTDALSKSLALEYPVFTVVFVRYFVAGLMALCAAIAWRRPIPIPRHHLIGHVTRTALMMGAMVLLIGALSMVPLAKAVGGFLIAPVVASLISVALFGEKLDSARIVGSAISFVGAFVILRPAGSIETGTLMALLGGVALGGYLAATRHSGGAGSLFSTLVVQSLLGAMLVAPFAFLHGIPVLAGADVGKILALGVVSLACHFLTVAAYKRTDASVLAPFFYFNIAFAIPVGLLWFGEVPKISTLFGLGAIALGGVVALRASPSTSQKRQIIATREVLKGVHEKMHANIS